MYEFPRRAVIIISFDLDYLATPILPVFINSTIRLSHLKNSPNRRMQPNNKSNKSINTNKSSVPKVKRMVSKTKLNTNTNED